VTDFASFIDENTNSMSAPLLAIMLSDCIKLRDWSREHGEINSATMFDVAINHINAEIARRDDARGPPECTT